MKELIIAVILAAILGVCTGYWLFKKECPTPQPIEKIQTEVCFEYRDTCLIPFPEVINPQPTKTKDQLYKFHEKPVTEFTHEVSPEMTFNVDLENEQIEATKTWSDWWEKPESQDPEPVIINKPINEYDLKSENEFGIIYSKIKTEGVLISWAPSFRLKEQLPDKINVSPAPVIVTLPEKVNRLQLNGGLQYLSNNFEPVIGAGFYRKKFGVNYNYLTDSKAHQLTACFGINF